MLTLSQGFLSFSHCPDSEEAGSAQKLGGDSTSTATQAGQRDILYCMILYSEINAEGGVCKALIAQELAECQSEGGQQLGFLFSFYLCEMGKSSPRCPTQEASYYSQSKILGQQCSQKWFGWLVGWMKKKWQ